MSILGDWQKHANIYMYRLNVVKVSRYLNILCDNIIRRNIKYMHFQEYIIIQYHHTIGYSFLQSRKEVTVHLKNKPLLPFSLHGSKSV